MDSILSLWNKRYNASFAKHQKIWRLRRGDILLSIGGGLYFSLVNNRNVISFYKRRLIRTLPYYLFFYGIVFAYFNLLQNFNFGQFLLNYTMLDFWIHGLGNAPWYLAAILVFYALYPLIYRVFFDEYRFKVLIVVLFLVVLCAICVTLSIFCSHLRIFFYRVPIFLLGCVAGKFVYEGREFKFWHGLILFAALVLGVIFFKLFKDVSIVRNILYIPLSLTIICIAAQIFKFNSAYCPVVNKPLEFLGIYTLEIYLTHEKVQENLFKVLNACGLNVQFGNIIYQIVCIILSIGISVGIASLIRFILKKISDTKRRKNSPM